MTFLYPGNVALNFDPVLKCQRLS